MKAKASKGGGKATMEKPQGRGKGSGVNAPMVKAKIPQVRPGVTVGEPTQKQKM